ncbi:MAG: aminoacyl--tRNA ligase-related protein, partial [Candidatus Gracilibacteria bacterium]
MLDLALFRDNPDLIRADLKKRHRDLKTVDQVISLDAQNRENLKKVESARAQKNEASDKIAKLKGEEKQAAIAEMKKVGEEEKIAHEKQEAIQAELNALLLNFPNITHSTTPEGPDESGNKVEKTHGKPKKFDFEVKDHVALGTNLGILNIEDAARMSGTRFAYLMGDAALLEFALMQFVIHKLVKKGFTPVIPPILVREHAMFATGFFPADRNEIYHVNPKIDENDKENDDLYLVGTAEVPLTMIHADKILDPEKLPLRYVGFSTCFRREAGASGKDTQGIIRVHQFDKIEMF